MLEFIGFQIIVSVFEGYKTQNLNGYLGSATLTRVTQSC